MFRRPPIIGLTAALAALACAAGASATAQSAKEPAKAKGPSYNEPRILAVSPVGAPVPALRYRLMPPESLRTPGDAAPVYIRLAIKAKTEGLEEINRLSNEWAELPLDRLPRKEVRTFLDRWESTARQLDFAARRESCRWNYTVSEQKEESLWITLQDAQEMRTWARLLTVKARDEIAEKAWDKAINTLETGIAAGRHAGEGPFVINTLVGVGCCHAMLGRIEEWIGQPGAPNLYWALTALPRPLVSTRAAFELEAILPERLCPELVEAERPHLDGEWAPLLARLHARIIKVEKEVYIDGKPAEKPAFPDLATFKAQVLPSARPYVAQRRGTIDGLSDDQVILVYVAGKYHDIYDDAFKDAYLPFAESWKVLAEAQKRVASLKGSPLEIFHTLMPNVEAVKRAETRLDQRVAALRVLEALRIHAAATGALPGSLDAVTAVPVPLNPMTGKPFAYRLEGKTAVLEGVEVSSKMALNYQITLRP